MLQAERSANGCVVVEQRQGCDSGWTDGGYETPAIRHALLVY